MTKLSPDLSRTLLAIGDTHTLAAGVTVSPKTGANERAALYQQRVLALGNPAGVAHVGDISEEGRPQEYALATPWWAAWPAPKIITPGNHDIDAGNGDIAAWEAIFGDRTQVLDTPFFRVVSCLWTATGHGGRGLNDAAGLAQVDALIGASGKPTALMFHYAVVGQYDDDGTNTVTAQAMANIRTLIDAHSNLQLVITGHTHSRLWMCNTPAGGIVSAGGRAILNQNVAATTYISNYGNTRSPIPAFMFTFYDDRYEVRIRECKADAWIPRFAGQPRVEVVPYT